MLNPQDFDRYLATIEKCLLSDDRQAFVRSLVPGATERQLFDLLAIEDANKFMEAARRLGFNDPQSLWLQKLTRIVVGDQPQDQKLKALKAIRETTNPFFDYERPTAFATGEQAETFVRGADTLKEEDYSLATYLKENTRAHVNVCQNLTDYGLVHLPEAEVKKLSRDAAQTYVDRVNLATLDERVFPVLRHYFDVSRAQNASFTLPSHLYGRLSLSQLEGLPKHLKEALADKQYFASLYRKGWGRELKELSTEPNQEAPLETLTRKRELIDKVRKWLAGFKTPLVASFEDQLLIEALQVDLAMERPDTELFLEYLRRPREVGIFKPEYRQKLQQRTDYQYDSFWHSVHGLEIGRRFNHVQLVENYLRLIFSREKPTAKTAELFYGFFEKAYVDGLLHRVLLARGDTPENLHTLLPKDELERLAAAKELTILDSNRRRFGLAEEVVLKLRVKNVRFITAQIYELSTEKHLLASTAPIDDSVSLDFVEPLTRVTKEVPTSSPYKETTVDFSLAKVLESRPSVYIVDFRGEGVSSRAVIRRGSIVALQRQTIAGIQVKFYQEDGTPIPELNVWSNNRRLQVKDRHVIPYGVSQASVRLVAVSNGFAEAITVNVPAEQYQLSVSYVYHEENFLVGTKARVLLQARLFCQGCPVTLKALRESRVTVSLLNHQNISSSFDTSIEWDHRNEFVLEVPVQTYLRNVSLRVTAKVDTYAGKPQDVESTHAILFQPPENDGAFVELFLFRDQEQFKVQLLGKNGEPKPNMNLSVTVISLLHNGSVTRSLMTNERGYVTLGRLPSVRSISVQTVATPDIQSVSGNWRIDSSRNEVQFPRYLYLRRGEELSLPLFSGFDPKQDLQFVRVDDHSQDIIANEKAQLKVHQQRLVGRLEQAGTYVLRLLPSDAPILVRVLEAKPWESEGQLLDEKRREVVSFQTNTHQLIGLGTPRIRSEQDGHAIELELSLPTDLPLESVRAHVVSSAFVYTVDQVAEIRKTLPPAQEPQCQEFTSKKCSYLSNKELSDEQCYVMNRQNEPKFVGNNLEKPRILLKRIEKRETSFDKEELKAGGDFRTKNACQELKEASVYNMARSRKIHGSAADGLGCVVLQQMTTKNNFLRHASSITPNLHGKVLSFKVPLHHQSFKVILTSQSFAIEREFGLPQTKLPVKDLRHLGLEDKDAAKEAITMSREIYRLQKGESLRVKRNSLWTAVSNSNVAAFSAIRGYKLWDWVTEWPNYAPEKKQQVYDEHACHELNVYLQRKDPEFFTAVVRPFIANKLEKGIVDFCLLEHPRALEFARPERTSTLNALESCLLVEYLIKTKQAELAQAIASSMELREKSNIISGELYQRQFDTIVTSKLVEERQNINIAPNPYSAFAAPSVHMDLMEC